MSGFFITMKYAALALSIIAILAVLLLMAKVSELERPAKEGTPLDAVHGGTTHGEEDLEVAIVMGRMQRFHQKFWGALEAGNAELAAFYLHELEEAMEEVAEANIVEEAADVSASMRTYGLPVVEHLEEKLKAEGIAGLRAEADLLVNSCNSCHQHTGYPFIKIRVPQGIGIPDQDLSP